MGDGAQPSMADVMKMLQTLSSNMSKMQSDMDIMQEKVASAADYGGHQDGQHRTDHPPKFQRMEFPRYDGKSDPLIFINKCESYFRHQRTMPEERYGWRLTTWTTWLSYGSSNSRRMRARRPRVASRNSSTSGLDRR
jgi:hypothetical protein